MILWCYFLTSILVDQGVIIVTIIDIYDKNNLMFILSGWHNYYIV